MDPSSTPVDASPALPAAIGATSFSVVRKGFDPAEVRAYLVALERRLAVAPTAAPVRQQEAAELLEAARVQAQVVLADARRRQADAHQAADRPPADPLDAHAEGIIDAARAQAAQMVAAARAESGATARPAVDGLGEHAARIVEQAEQEAGAMVAEATAAADARRAALAEERTGVEAVLASAQAEALATIAEAERRSAAQRAEQEPRARARIEAALAEADAQLETHRQAQRAARAQLEAVHDQVAGLLAGYPAVVDAFLGVDPFRRPADDGGPTPAVAPAPEPDATEVDGS